MLSPVQKYHMLSTENVHGLVHNKSALYSSKCGIKCTCGMYLQGFGVKQGQVSFAISGIVWYQSDNANKLTYACKFYNDVWKRLHVNYQDGQQDLGFETLKLVFL